MTLTVKEQKRLKVMVELDAGRITGREAADVLGVSLRHAWRPLAAFQEEGAAGLVHENRRREPLNKTPQATRERILTLAEERYADYNDSHFTEKLEQEHESKVSRPTLRRLRRSIGQGSPPKLCCNHCSTFPCYLARSRIVRPMTTRTASPRTTTTIPAVIKPPTSARLPRP